MEPYVTLWNVMVPYIFYGTLKNLVEPLQTILTGDTRISGSDTDLDIIKEIRTKRPQLVLEG